MLYGSIKLISWLKMAIKNSLDQISYMNQLLGTMTGADRSLEGWWLTVSAGKCITILVEEVRHLMELLGRPSPGCRFVQMATVTREHRILPNFLC